MQIFAIPFPEISATLWWTITLGLMLVGLVGTLVPLLPGTIIILAAAVLHRFTLGPEASVSGWTLAGLTLLMVISHVLDFISGSVGAKKFGATRWGALGGILGAVVGLFFGLPGIFVGPVVGVLAGELISGRGLLPAGRSSWGTLLGTTAGIVCNFLLGAMMIGWFLVAALWR